MRISETDRFIHVQSSCYGIALAKDRPVIGYLSVESGGRKRQHLDVNLLRPGPAGAILPDADGSAPLVAARRETSAVVYDQVPFAGGNVRCRVEFPDERSIILRLSAQRGTLPKDLLRLAFAPDRSPMSFWARPLDWDAPRRAPNWDLLEPTCCEVQFILPGLATFPDFGTLRIDADPAVHVLERLVPDPANAGMNLGLSNVGHHNVRTAFHHGHFDLCFFLDRPADEIAITLHVEPERHPQIPGCDFSDPRFAGLRRLWMNAFTLNPMTLTMGDNPILAGTAHLSIHWKSDMAALTGPLLPGLSVMDFVRHTLERTFERHTDEAGKMHGYGWENGATNLIALHDYVLFTGDLDFVRKHLPTIRRVIDYNLALDADGDGLLEAAYHGNHFHDPKTSLNWWDDFAFGHKDAYGNLVYHQAFSRIAGVLRDVGAGDLAQRLEAFLARFRESFHRTFFNPQTGVYAGWVSRDGRMHDYLFTFIAAMAINQGLLEGEPARAMLGKLLEALERNGYGAFRWGVPGPAIPVDPADRGDWAPMTAWGQYENGGFCGQTAYHFILALYRAGMREQADRILFNMIETFDTLPTHSGLNPGFTRSVDWRNRDGMPCGYNYLADNYVFLLAAIQGHFGVDLPEAVRRQKSGA